MYLERFRQIEQLELSEPFRVSKPLIIHENSKPRKNLAQNKAVRKRSNCNGGNFRGKNSEQTSAGHSECGKTPVFAEISQISVCEYTDILTNIAGIMKISMTASTVDRLPLSSPLKTRGTLSIVSETKPVTAIIQNIPRKLTQRETRPERKF